MKFNPRHHLPAALPGVAFASRVHVDAPDPMDFSSSGALNVTTAPAATWI